MSTELGDMKEMFAQMFLWTGRHESPSLPPRTAIILGMRHMDSPVIRDPIVLGVLDGKTRAKSSERSMIPSKAEGM